MSAHFSVRIRDGQANGLVCPEAGCDARAFPDEVKRLVPPDLFAAYESRLLETTLNSMSDVLLCPRRHCQVPVLMDREYSVAHCPNERCGFAFCIYCKSAYHGREPCRVGSREHRELVRKYLDGDAGERAGMERRYGRRQLARLADEFLSEAFKEENAQRCPRCRAPIEKADGCNKMTCNK